MDSQDAAEDSLEDIDLNEVDSDSEGGFEGDGEDGLESEDGCEGEDGVEGEDGCEGEGGFEGEEGAALVEAECEDRPCSPGVSESPPKAIETNDDKCVLIEDSPAKSFDLKNLQTEILALQKKIADAKRQQTAQSFGYKLRCNIFESGLQHFLNQACVFALVQQINL